ncbi:XisI protein [Baaleninema simplex]|uniref:XisI protein n=1 Tax=Baaleninema simplex TaxID=2862350 RepID=UPI000345DD6A|nr:XisI protein [Baaleninema simplex]
MDTLAQYRQFITQLLSDRAANIWDKRVDAKLVFDRERDRYLLIYVGWFDSTPLYGIVLHAEIIDSKIWIYQDGTEQGLANQLVELGVPKEKIVLAFHPPSLRKYTEFAVQ